MRNVFVCCCALLVVFVVAGCKKDSGLLVLDPQSREALYLPQLRPLSLPPRYNLDGGESNLSRPAASLSAEGSVRLSEIAPSIERPKATGKDAAFLQRLRLETRDPEVRRRIAEERREAVPLSQPLLDAIRRNNAPER